MEKSKNTYKRGAATTIIYPEGNLYTAVCLEFDLVEQAKDFKEAREKIDDAIKSHFYTVVKNKLPEELLNRPAPIKYWKKAGEILGNSLKRKQRRGVSEKPFVLEKQPIENLIPSYV